MVENLVVTACAGSGKTYRLVSRLIALLEAGAKPAEILVITFTHKAAAEIRERLFEMLLEKSIDNPLLAEWRKRLLLAEHPDDVFNVHTFHSWFMALMHNTPWREGRITPLTLRAEQEELFEQAWRRWQKQVEARPPKNLKTVLAELSPHSLHQMLGSFYQNRNAWRLYQRQQQQTAVLPIAPLQELCAVAARYAEAMSAGGGGQVTQQTAISAAQQLAAVCGHVGNVVNISGVDNINNGNNINDVDNVDNDDNNEKCNRALLAMENAFFTNTGTPRVQLKKSADKLGCADVFENLILLLNETLTANEEQQAAVFNVAASAVFESFDETVEQLKKTAGEMTFDDLELQVWEMLSEENIYSALSHRLYTKYRHVLIDEFQDTSPIQWSIIHRWLLDSHGNDAQPTVFIVGDTKQAIYGFRHGDARLLGHAADFLREHYGAEPPEELHICRRCGGNIINVVNETFKQCELMHDFVPHEVGGNAGEKHGRVEWHVYRRPSKISATTEDKIEGKVENKTADAGAVLSIRNPLSQPLPDGDDVQTIRARAVAAKVREIIDTWYLRDGENNFRACRAEDILILLPAFTHAEAQTDALSAQNIDCAAGGRADSLSPFECEDILDLISVLLSPSQSYPLARVLKSPLFGLDDSQLSALVNNDGETLWEKLQQQRGENELRRARILLAYWHRRARDSLLPAHDFLARLYRQGDVTARYRAASPQSLRRRVGDNLLRLLDLSLLTGGGGRPLLAQFLEDARAGRYDSMQASAGVRLMTIHAAKGLESPVVILADASFPEIYSRGGSIDILLEWPPNAASPSDFMASPRRLTRAGQDLRQQAREKHQREQANQLYVAMTRAQQALIIFAPEPCKQPSAWAENAMQFLTNPPPSLTDEIYKADETDKVDKTSSEKISVANTSAPFYYGESFCLSDESMPIAETVTEVKHVVENSASTSSSSFSSDSALTKKQIGERRDDSAAAVRGENRHRIMALLLSGLSLSQAKRLFAAEPSQWREAETMLQSSGLQALLSAGKQILIEREFALNGEIIRPDLVIISEKELWIVDYKTGKVIPHKHLPQLQKYAQAVSPHYPNLSSRLAILDIRGELHDLSV